MADIDGWPGSTRTSTPSRSRCSTAAVGAVASSPSPTSLDGLTDMLALLDSFVFAIGRIGVEGSAGLGRHVAAFLVAAGYDVR